MRPDGSGQVKVDLGSDPDIYLARVNWTADGKALLVQRQSRDQKRLDLLRVDPVTGKSSLLFSETSRSWLNFARQSEAAQGRQPALVLGTLRLCSSLPVAQRQVAAAYPRQLGSGAGRRRR
jgi:hypothetical protein